MNSSITVEKVTKKRSYFLLKLKNCTEIIKLHQSILGEFSLFEGKVLTLKELDEIKERSDYLFAWDSALRFLSIRAHSEKELINKLKKKGFLPKNIEKVIQETKRLSFIDDEKFAELYVDELKWKASSKRMISSKLYEKGIPQEIISKVLEEKFDENDELEAARRIFAKKKPSLERESDLKKRKIKLFRYMSSRGFSYEIIDTIYNEF